MNKYLTEWNDLNTYDKKGKAFRTRQDIKNAISSKAFKYASITSLILSVFFFFLGKVV